MIGLGIGVKLDLSAEEYGNAVGLALGLIEANAASSQAQAMKLVLASVWDTVAYVNTIDCLAAMDGPTRDIALCLIIGRAYYGRPSDSIACTAELERVFQEVYRGQVQANDQPEDTARRREPDRNTFI